MRAPLLLLCLLIVLFSCSESQEETPTNLPKVVSGNLERIENFSSKFVTARGIDIWLPEGYNPEGSKKYPVLYMHDGQMLYDSTTTWNGQEWGVDDVMTSLIKQGKVEPTIVVGVFNGDRTRHPDYFPQKPFESLPDTFQSNLLYNAKRNEKSTLFPIPVNSDNYLRFLVEEVKPYIDENYATLKDMEHTFVAGSSMGGLISMYAICEYPEIFSGAACLSTHWIGIFNDDNNPIPDAFVSYMSENLPNPTNHKLYFDFGTETLDAYYEPHQKKVDSVMLAKGFENKNWLTMKFPGENHSEIAWNKRLHIPLTFLMSKN